MGVLASNILQYIDVNTSLYESRESSNFPKVEKVVHQVFLGYEQLF